MAEDEVGIIPRLVPVQQAPSFIKNAADSMRNYDRFRTKKSRPFTGTSLKCKEHPHLEDLTKISKEEKAFYEEEDDS